MIGAGQKAPPSWHFGIDLLDEEPIVARLTVYLREIPFLGGGFA